MICGALDALVVVLSRVFPKCWAGTSRGPGFATFLRKWSHEPTKVLAIHK